MALNKMGPNWAPNKKKLPQMFQFAPIYGPERPRASNLGLGGTWTWFWGHLDLSIGGTWTRHTTYCLGPNGPGPGPNGPGPKFMDPKELGYQCIQGLNPWARVAIRRS